MSQDTQRRRRIGWLAFAGLILALAALAITAGVAAASGAAPPAQAQTPTATAPGQLQLPTATPTVPGGPTAPPSSTPSVVPVQAEIIGDPTNLRTGPGIDFEIVAELSPGELVPITGRWLGYDWLLVQWDDAPGGEAWVYLPLVIVRGDITTVPAVDPPAPPTADPTEVAAEATATILLQTPGAVETATATALLAPTGVFTRTPEPGGEAVAGELPTFTPPPPYVQPEELPVPEAAQRAETPLPPAVIIITLGAMGAFTLALGLLRRLF
jgi:hypothetical protein